RAQPERHGASRRPGADRAAATHFPLGRPLLGENREPAALQGARPGRFGPGARGPRLRVLDHGARAARARVRRSGQDAGRHGYQRRDRRRHRHGASRAVRLLLRRPSGMAGAVRRQKRARPVRLRRGRRRDLARDDHGHEREPRDPQQLPPNRPCVPDTARAAAVSARTLLDRLRAAALGALGGAALLACGPLHAQDTAEDDGGWDFDDLDEPEPTLFELFQDQALEVGLFAAFATLAMVSFFKKSKPLKYVALVASVLYLGVYKSLLLSVVNIFGSLSAALASLDLVEDLPGSLPIFAYSIG